MFENNDLENNFVNFMKIIKFKHQKHNVSYRRRDGESQQSEEEEEEQSCQQDQNAAQGQLANFTNHMANQINQINHQEEGKLQNQKRQVTLIQQQSIEELKDKVQNTLNGLNLHDLKPECISEEICAQIVSLLEAEPEKKSEIKNLKQYFYQKELVLYSSLLKNSSLEIYNSTKEKIQKYEDNKASNSILAGLHCAVDAAKLKEELEMLKARNTVKDLEDKYGLAY